MDMTIVGAVLLVVVIVIAAQTVKIVPQQHAWVVERFGRYHATLAPGLNIVLPFADRVAYRHVLKEIPLDVPGQICITRDNTQLQVDGVLYFQVTDAMKASYGSSNYVSRLRSCRKRRCVRSSASSNWTKPSKSAISSTTASYRRSTKPRRAGASRCCAMKSKT